LPRISPFRIILTKQEQEESEARARKHTAPYREVLRAKIVLLAAQGLSNDVIAARAFARQFPRTRTPLIELRINNAMA
jgi:hypothetical protein